MDDLLLPLFPLEVVLFPQQPFPVHIFEERYKEMIGECLAAKAAGKGQQEFGVLLAQGEQLAAIGCTARILNVTRKYEDGRMDLFTVGSRRFEILYTDDERAYLRGGVQFFDDEPEHDLPSEANAKDAIELFRSAMQRLRESPEVAIHLPRPYRHLSFRIAAPLPLSAEFKQEMLGLRDESERLRRVTHAIRQWLAHVERIQRARAKAGGNGNVRPEI
jgi:Lon protease-like protein